MTRFVTNALAILKCALFQEKPFIVLTIGSDELNVAYTGNEHELVDALSHAMQHDENLKRVITSACIKSKPSDLPSVLRTIKVA